MKFYKNKQYYIGFSHVNAKAYKVSNVWKLGFHFFETDDAFVFRVCFLRTRKRTYYWQFEKVKKARLETYDKQGIL